MTAEQICELGFYQDSPKVHPRRFESSYWGSFTFPESFNLELIVNMIFEEGKNQGIEIGKIDKTNEFRKVLGMKDIKD